MAAIGGFLLGYDTGVISGAMLQIKRTFHLNPVQQEEVVSVTILAALVGSLFGRKPCILFSSVIFTVGSILVAFSVSSTTLILSRLVLGMGIGVSSLTIPMYIAELAEPGMRGSMVTINSCMVAFGQVAAGLVDGLFEEVDHDQGWRYMLGMAAFPSLLMMLVSYFCLPESPRWLVMSGQERQAQKVLTALRKTDEDALLEIKSIVQSIRENGDLDLMVETMAKRRRIPSPTIGDMIRDTSTRRALMLGCGLMALQQFCGINTVKYYGATIYQMSQFDEETAIWLNGFTAIAEVVGIVTSIALVERVGRRPLILTSLALVMVSLVALGTFFYFARTHSREVLITQESCGTQPALIWSGVTSYCSDCVNIPQCGYCMDTRSCLVGDENGSPFCIDWEYSSCKIEFGSWVSVMFMVLYLLAFGVGMGGLPWTLNSEIYSLQYRSLAVSLATSTNWWCNFVVSATFLSISSPGALTTYGTFWLYAFIAALGFVWLYIALPETKGLTLEEIERLFRRNSEVFVEMSSLPELEVVSRKEDDESHEAYCSRTSYF
eukprot:CAMPEP_0118685932 /NCGR_PEP_ID=MMETSP0800-20121206/7527_1 /TAXON_ID=210618 ORGANISM="Striatella unipunctata, Strain CCMP2910" /NCGR_SAMPLE_ID=MMETSP0800 /ASSEMBLY_ACC=CAM_ASM_000638 /LENGTH=548 /DNA_ID=CAMNT_0006582911 /DNA_START=58 /DNA_END=1705 /DNA_ORIENTATION=-